MIKKKKTLHNAIQSFWILQPSFLIKENTSHYLGHYYHIPPLQINQFQKSVIFQTHLLFCPKIIFRKSSLQQPFNSYHCNHQSLVLKGNAPDQQSLRLSWQHLQTVSVDSSYYVDRSTSSSLPLSSNRKTTTYRNESCPKKKKPQTALWQGNQSLNNTLPDTFNHSGINALA